MSSSQLGQGFLLALVIKKKKKSRRHPLPLEEDPLAPCHSAFEFNQVL